MKCRDKIPYDSRMLADNAAWLHAAAHPTCDGVNVYEHDGHWHIGHDHWWASRHCQEDPSPRVRKPQRVLPGGRRYDTTKAKSGA